MSSTLTIHTLRLLTYLLELYFSQAAAQNATPLPPNVCRPPTQTFTPDISATAPPPAAGATPARILSSYAPDGGALGSRYWEAAASDSLADATSFAASLCERFPEDAASCWRAGVVTLVR